VKNGFFITGGGFEYNLELGVSALSLAFTGRGTVSFDALLDYSPCGVYWGTGALVLAGLGAGILLSQRRHGGVKQTAGAVAGNTAGSRVSVRHSGDQADMTTKCRGTTLKSASELTFAGRRRTVSPAPTRASSSSDVHLRTR
jgi:hypothetical protein